MVLASRADSSPDSRVFERLVHTLRQQKESGDPGTAVVLGAGCSLSSSPTDITTLSILRRILTDLHRPNEPIDARRLADTEVYRHFVNWWHQNGEIFREDTLRRHLYGLSPSKGYRALRRLVDAGYIRNIVTTNFDLLIDEVMTGLCYELQVGADRVERLGSETLQLSVLKAHGDIRRGGMRFSPHDLTTLPDAVSRRIEEMTRGPTVVIGYRGQDVGFMRSLHATAKYHAFWVNLDLPDRGDAFTAWPVYDWMNNRNASENFLYGEGYGRFDDCMEALASELLDKRNRLLSLAPPSSLPAPWKDSVIGERLRQNQRLTELFSLLLEHLAAAAQRRQPQARPPQFSADYTRLMSALLAPLPMFAAVCKFPENEVDAFLLGLALEVSARAATVAADVAELIEEAARRHAERPGKYRTESALWDTLAQLCNPGRNVVDGSPLILPLNAQGRMVVHYERPPLHELKGLIFSLRHLALLYDTGGATALQGELAELRALFLEHAVLNQQGPECLTVRVAGLEASRVADIFDAFFGEIPDARMESSGSIRSHWATPWVNWEWEIAEPSVDKRPSNIPTTERGLIGTLIARSKRSSRHYLAFTTPQLGTDVATVELAADRIIDVFLDSSAAGLFAVGASGVGKSTAIRRLIESDQAQQRYLPMVIAAADGLPESSCRKAFFPDLHVQTEDDWPIRLGEIDRALGERGNRLLLILDGLNELPGTFDTVVELYRELLALAGAIYDGHCQHIKLLVTTRELSFFEAVSSAGRPSVVTFFCPEGADDSTVSPYLIVPEVSPEERRRLIEAHCSSPEVASVLATKLETNSALGRAMSNPHLLAVAAHVIHTVEDIKNLRSVQEVYQRFTEAMLARIPKSFLKHAREFIDEYCRLRLTSIQSQVSRQSIADRFGAGEIPVAAVERELREVNLFRGGQMPTPFLLISHDRIEEYLLGRYLYDHPQEEDLLKNAIAGATHYPVMLGVIKAWLGLWVGTKHNEKTDGETQQRASLLVRKIATQSTAHHEQIGMALAEVIMLSCDETAVTAALDWLLEGAAWVPGAQTRGNNSRRPFARLLLDGIRRALTERPSEELINVVRGLKTKLDRVALLAEFEGELLWLEALATSHLTVPGRSESALRLCEEAANKVATGRSDLTLSHRIARLRAELFSERGLKQEAIEALQPVLEQQLGAGVVDEAARTILALGRMYRDDTRFTEAARLYADFQKKYPNLMNRDVRAMLALQAGIIEKNLLQQCLKEQACDRETMQHYSNAKHYYQHAMDHGDHDGLPALLLEAIIERIELELEMWDWLKTSESDIDLFIDKADQCLANYPVAQREIELLRMKASRACHRENLSEAIAFLGQARDFAEKFNLGFNVADCDYQLGFLILDHGGNPLPEALLNMGENAFSGAIAYYEANVSPNNAYLRDVRDGLARLRQRYGDGGDTSDRCKAVP